ncbi:hypothetical protein FIC_01103 [Flavobacteriaceae bacterium 3519-10]|nr:hypothetical protein FIC_01103 [Flavobacteriaceae bacterium 3519-10]
MVAPTVNIIVYSIAVVPDKTDVIPSLRGTSFAKQK